MKEIILATSNLHKIEEIQSILKNLNIKIIPMTSFLEYPNIEEDGVMLEDNAIKKATEAARFFKKWTIADDSGLEVDFLNGAPGVYSARYAGNGCSYDDNNKKLLAVLEGVPEIKRTAKFRTIIAISSPNERVYLSKGSIFGTIALKCVGTKGFGYDSIFYIPEYGKTFSELEPEIKNSISHRAKALQKAKEIIKYLVDIGE
jgi:XTP/dITP diphosphohydrolase